MENGYRSFRECASQWLQHAVAFGDIGRILETILLILLDPSTSRIAIHYAPLLIKKKAGHLVNSGSSNTSNPFNSKEDKIRRAANHESSEKISSEDDEKDKDKSEFSISFTNLWICFSFLTFFYYFSVMCIGGPG